MYLLVFGILAMMTVYYYNYLELKYHKNFGNESLYIAAALVVCGIIFETVTK